MGKLKAAFSNLQEKQRKAQIQKAKDAARKDLLMHKRATAAAGRPSAKAKGKRPIPHTIPFTASDTILLLGEGNFSFARALFTSEHQSLQHLPPSNVTATAYDSEEECYEKYPDAKEIVAELRERGVNVMFSIDARKLGSYKDLKMKKWKRVVWNFPHAGKGISDQDRNVFTNQILVLDFLKAVAPLLEDGVIATMAARSRRKKKKGDDDDDSDYDGIDLTENSQIKERGTVMITLKNAPPYTLWDLSNFAKKPPEPHITSVAPAIPNVRYVQVRSFAFRAEAWKGYEHRMTKGYVAGISRGHGGGGDGKQAEDRTWEFCLTDED
ncbi:hypothetical protein M422DRAFT_154933 [Sphaerobolus stellatus SS14]|nr:hypothetical protein M422DRAFT_154933 [Sphaerobolus stellatus SS14]